jgi:hypothetical protein
MRRTTDRREDQLEESAERDDEGRRARNEMTRDKATRGGRAMEWWIGLARGRSSLFERGM